MKLALMALVIETCLFRVFAGSWAWAVVCTVVYCILVYGLQMVRLRRHNTNKSETDSGNIYIQGNRKNQRRMSGLYPNISLTQKN